MTDRVLLAATGLEKVFRDGPREVRPFPAVDLRLNRGETLAVVGPSGSGKSTLLQLLGGLDTPTAGEIVFEGESLGRMDDRSRTRMRNRSLGFVYQFHHLLGEFTALDNVAMPLLVRRMETRLAHERAQAILDRVGLHARASHRPSELSGGERQRVALARALVTEPSLVLADEPTGNLDRDAARLVFDLMIERVRDQSSALIVVTHDAELASRCDRIFSMPTAAAA